MTKPDEETSDDEFDYWIELMELRRRIAREKAEIRRLVDSDDLSALQRLVRGWSPMAD